MKLNSKTGPLTYKSRTVIGLKRYIYNNIYKLMCLKYIHVHWCSVVSWGNVISLGTLKLVLAECMRQQSALRWPLFLLFFHMTYPAQASVHILRDLLPPLFKTTEGVVVLFQIFAWAPKKK